MFKRIVVAAAALVSLAAGRAGAQERDQRLVAKEPQKLAIPLCNLKGGSGKVGDGQKQLKIGLEDKDAAKRAASLQSAEQILKEAVGTGGQGQNAAAWYYLARTYLAQGDLTGADSAFTKAQMLAPDCEIDINQYRQNTWAGIARVGIEKQQAGDIDSALVLFREASRIFGNLPHVFENMGVMFANQGQPDSAAVYFAKAAEVAEAKMATDSSLIDNRNSATLNLGMMQQRLGKHQEAVATFRKYLSWNAKDSDARKSLVYSLRETGMTSSADSLEKAIVDEFTAMNPDSLSTSDLMAVGVNLFNAQKYQEAAEVFRRLYARNSWSRDAVYNLANTYLALKDNEKLVAAARRLLEIEPMNEDAYKLLGQGFRELKQQDSLLKTAEGLVTLPVNVEVTAFTMSQSSGRLTATVTGRNATDAKGTPLKPVPVALVVDFLSVSGSVVGSQEVNIPALQAGATHQLRAEAKGTGIEGWRYRRK